MFVGAQADEYWMWWQKDFALKIIVDGSSEAIGLCIHSIVATHSQAGKGSHIQTKVMASLTDVAAPLLARIYSRDTD